MCTLCRLVSLHRKRRTSSTSSFAVRIANDYNQRLHESLMWLSLPYIQSRESESPTINGRGLIMEGDLTNLTAYQLRFIDEYMKCGNKRKAMLAAGYKGKGKRSTVTSAASRMYSNPKVLAEIERRRAKLADENIIDSRQIVSRLAKMFRGELKSQFVTKSGDVVETPITFKNQIEAAKVLVNILGISAEGQGRAEIREPVAEKLSDDLQKTSEEFLKEAKQAKTPKALENK
jgi:phage terminase small subunit